MRQVLDHVAVVVPDLARAAGAYRRLGFNLTRASSHKGALEPGGPVELWGAGNHCAMFEQGYLEVLGVTDPARHHAHVDARLARYHGLHLVAIGCDDAAAMERGLRARAIPAKAMVRVGRDVPYGEGTRPGEFEIVGLAEDLFPEADLFYIAHPTRDLLWQPQLLAQPNGVTALTGAVICAADPDEVGHRLAWITARAASATSRGREVSLDVGRIVVCTPAQLAASFPGATPPALPSVAAVEFAVRDRGATAAFLDSQGIACEVGPDGSLQVAAADAEGAWIAFR